MHETNQSCQNRGPIGVMTVTRSARRGRKVGKELGFPTHSHFAHMRTRGMQMCTKRRGAFRISFSPLSSAASRSFSAERGAHEMHSAGDIAIGRSVGRSVGCVSLRRMNKILFSFHAAKRRIVGAPWKNS